MTGMTDDLGMDSAQYSVALVVFFVTYVVFEVSNQLCFDSQTLLLNPAAEGSIQPYPFED